MQFAIRRADIADYEMLLDTMEEVDQDHREQVPNVFRAPEGPSRSRAYIQSILDDPDRALWVAESEHLVIGVLHIGIRTAPDTPIHIPRSYAVIDLVVVRRSFRQQGIGRALMEHAHRWALSKDILDVELGVYEFNKGAIAFYEDLGYVTSRRTLRLSLDQLPDSRRSCNEL